MVGVVAMSLLGVLACSPRLVCAHALSQARHSLTLHPPTGRNAPLLRLRGGWLGAGPAQRRLFDAAQIGDVDALETAITQGADVNAPDPLGAMALHMARSLYEFIYTRGRTQAATVRLHHGTRVQPSKTQYNAVQCSEIQ